MVFSSENVHLLCLNALKPNFGLYCYEPRTDVGMWKAHYRVLIGLCFLDILPPSLLRNHYLLFELKCQLSSVTKRQLLLLLSWVSLCLHRWFFTARWRTCDCGAAQAGANGVNFDFFESKIQDKNPEFSLQSTSNRWIDLVFGIPDGLHTSGSLSSQVIASWTAFFQLFLRTDF